VKLLFQFRFADRLGEQFGAIVMPKGAGDVWAFLEAPNDPIFAFDTMLSLGHTIATLIDYLREHGFVRFYIEFSSSDVMFFDPGECFPRKNRRYS
jgi:hypothetical protein